MTTFRSFLSFFFKLLHLQKVFQSLPQITLRLKRISVWGCSEDSTSRSKKGGKVRSCQGQQNTMWKVQKNPPLSCSRDTSKARYKKAPPTRATAALAPLWSAASAKEPESNRQFFKSAATHAKREKLRLDYRTNKCFTLGLCVYVHVYWYRSTVWTQTLATS